MLTVIAIVVKQEYIRCSVSCYWGKKLCFSSSNTDKINKKYRPIINSLAQSGSHLCPYTYTAIWVLKDILTLFMPLGFVFVCLFIFATGSKSRKYGRAPRKISPGKGITSLGSMAAFGVRSTEVQIPALPPTSYKIWDKGLSFMWASVSSPIYLKVNNLIACWEDLMENCIWENLT